MHRLKPWRLLRRRAVIRGRRMSLQRTLLSVLRLTV